MTHDTAGTTLSGDEFVIEELSRRTGVSVRSLRSYQTRGLLPPPKMRGRTGFYGAQHVARVRLVQQLRGAGLKLDGIARMLGAPAEDADQLVAFTRRARGMFDEAAHPVTTIEELVARFGVSDDARALLARAESLGLLRLRADGSVEELVPRLLAAGEAAMRTLGLDAREALDLLEQLREHADGVARIYMDLFASRIWEPLLEAGRQDHDWEALQQSLTDLRRLSTEALDATFELAMAQRIEQESGRLRTE